MSGPWEAYQSAAPAGPWDAYRTESPKKPAEPAYDPTEGMLFGDKLNAGAGKAMVDTYRGLKQLLASATSRRYRPRSTRRSGWMRR
jgi:hypothetical protein